MTADLDALREQYVATIEHEIVEARARLAIARQQLGDEPRAVPRSLAAVADVTLDWLEAERDRLRAGGPFDEAAACRFLGEARP